MSKKQPLGDISPSICEAVFAEYGKLDDSLAELIRDSHIQVRDFIILSFVCDQGGLSTEQIAQILGTTPTETRACIDRLLDSNMIRYTDGHDKSEGDQPICVTPTGRLVAMRVHGFPAIL